MSAKEIVEQAFLGKGPLAIASQITQALMTDGQLSAKDLAKKLEIEKSVINKILYQRNDIYVKDDATPPKWRIHEMWKPPQILPDTAQGTFHFDWDQDGKHTLVLTPRPGYPEQDLIGFYDNWKDDSQIDEDGVKLVMQV